MPRAFVALPVEEPGTVVRLVEAQDALRAIRGVSWVRPAQFHVTLKFLGDVSEETLAKTATALGGLHAPRFSLELRGLGTFPFVSRARVVWAGCAQGAAALTGLAAAVESILVEAGLPAEPRPFSPHLTLGRIRDPRAGSELSRAIAAFDGRPFGTFGAVEGSEVVLFESRLHAEGAEHLARLRVPLESSGR
jgi:RNA 2',3'-cyclic 3'-phosphodiesterase